MTVTRASKPNFYNAVWRWHFYAGMLCIPFIIWLAVTGSLYLWRPQIEAWLDKPYSHLAVHGPAATPDAQVTAALAAVPGAKLAKYQVPDSPDSAVQILVKSGEATSRVYVDPVSTGVMKVAAEEDRLFHVISNLHGTLLAGTLGSYVVEIAACWAIVMILTGLFLWWPRGAAGVAGVLYPRLGAGGRVFWRDIHATTGLWVSFFALFLILTGLPWAKGWGSYLKEVREVTGTTRGTVDWTIGGKAPAAEGDEHAGHAGHAGMDHTMIPGMTMPMAGPKPGDLARVIAAVTPLGMAPPVLISPPRQPGAPWSAASDAADRSLRSEAKLDGATGAVVSRTGFAEKHIIDKLVGYGISVHEGAFFGLFNQLLGTLTAMFLVLLAVSGAVMWWRRRPTGLLGAPIPLAPPRFGPGLVALIVALGLYMPMFGATLLAVLLVERFVLAKLPETRRWLGLRSPAAA